MCLSIDLLIVSRELSSIGLIMLIYYCFYLFDVAYIVICIKKMGNVQITRVMLSNFFQFGWLSD